MYHTENMAQRTHRSQRDTIGNETMDISKFSLLLL
jgi:hypothetical protein